MTPSTSLHSPSRDALQPSTASVSTVARRLRSKCTIDVLETIEEKRRKGNGGKGGIAGQRVERLSGTRSAPQNLNRNHRSGGGQKPPPGGQVSPLPAGRSGETSDQERIKQAMDRTLQRMAKNGGASLKAHPNSYLTTKNAGSGSSDHPPTNTGTYKNANYHVVSVQGVATRQAQGENRSIHGIHDSATRDETAVYGSPSGVHSSSQYFISDAVLSGDFPSGPETTTATTLLQQHSHRPAIKGAVQSPVKSLGERSPASQSSTSPKQRSNQQSFEIPFDPLAREREYLDIQGSIARLKQFDDKDGGGDKHGAGSNLAKKAVKLGDHFNNAEKIMSQYKSLVNEFD